MTTKIRRIPLDRLMPHPDNPNYMSEGNLRKLAGHIERTGRYEPLVVRPCPGRPGFFQIINGYHRCAALRKLGHQTAEVVVWDVDDEQTDVLLATLNRLNGRDHLDRKLVLLRRLARRIPTRKLARLLPQTLGQLERLVSRRPLAPAEQHRVRAFALPMVFFVDEKQQQMIEDALALITAPAEAGTRAGRRAAALASLARHFLNGKSLGRRSRSVGGTHASPRAADRA